MPFCLICFAMACQKDHQAFEMLYEHYKKPLERYLVRLVKNAEVASDLCQDTFMHAWKYVSEQEHISEQFTTRFEAWFYRVAKNLAIDYIRHNRRYEFVPLSDSDSDDSKGRAYVIDLSVPGHEELVCELLHVKEVLQRALVPPSPMAPSLGGASQEEQYITQVGWDGAPLYHLGYRPE